MEEKKSRQKEKKVVRESVKYIFNLEKPRSCFCDEEFADEELASGDAAENYSVVAAAAGLGASCDSH